MVKKGFFLNPCYVLVRTLDKSEMKGVDILKIERVNDNTVKFFITYTDIERRGFARDEIWYNRERGEQLFWQMMDEANEKESISFEGPLWIQVQAFEKGLEVTVTIAKTTVDGEQVDEEELDSLLRSAMSEAEDKETELSQDVLFETTDFEHVIALSQYAEAPVFKDLKTALYQKDGAYLLHVHFKEDVEVEEQENVMSLIAEYLQFSEQTIHPVAEYGKTIIADDVFAVVRKHFTN
ncbi:adaptor protein controlling oligomerization of the AAA+ protein ClpC [Exiguobacterium oxidotolerans]|uniref:Adapter protein MecA n=1 Tax=Exiguobacterium oxidotolerans TaxID=223958 RepID=A0A653IC22_9BACL|nr:adaptor protein controlling oligomerization of the AAA+ protein ClpC [Exiguobacterium oxidotolerans]